jgi:Ca2+-binding RTX toxin-like protein
VNFLWSASHARTVLLPALLGFGLIFSISDNDDDETSGETSREEPDVVDVPEGEDFFQGSAQSETINAREEGGRIFAGEGDDTVNGSEADDIILGEEGDDAIFAKGGDDLVGGSEGNDRVFLGDGDDESSQADGDISITAGDDFIRGGAGNDFISDGLGANTLFGGLGNDVISAIDGDNANGGIEQTADFGSEDQVFGGQGSDGLFGDDGDTLTGGSGDDAFHVLRDFNRDQDSVNIADFNTSDDVLVFRTIAEGTEEHAIDFEFDPDRNAVIASDGDIELAIIEGLRAADIPQIQSNLIVFRA